jgi:hypothetical protein
MVKHSTADPELEGSNKTQDESNGEKMQFYQNDFRFYF